MNFNALTTRVSEIFTTGLASLLTDDTDSAADRRAYTRVPVAFEGSIDWDGRRIPVRGLDLHRAGAGISIDEALPPQSLVFFYDKSHGLMGWATVRWCAHHGRSKYHAGLEFRSALMRAEAGKWQFSYVQAPGCASAASAASAGGN